MPMYELDGLRPVVDPTAFVHPDAVLIGDVLVGPGCYVAPQAVMRGDFGRMILEAGANLQDCCVMHGFPGTECRVCENGHIGHGAVLHGCTIGPGALVGMKAVVMDEAVIGAAAIVAACAFVKAGTTIPDRSLAAGIPAKVLRPLTDEDIAWKHLGTLDYQALTRRCQDSLRPCVPLTEPEPDRPRMPMQRSRPKGRG